MQEPDGISYDITVPRGNPKERHPTLKNNVLNLEAKSRNLKEAFKIS